MDYYRDKLRMCQSMQSTGKLQLSPNAVYDFTSEDLQDLGEIGRGGFGTVNKMIHRISDTVMAVKVCNFIIFIIKAINQFIILYLIIENSFYSGWKGAKTIINGFRSCNEI